MYIHTYVTSRKASYIRPNRKKSEKYGFVVPLRPDLHPNGAHVGQSASVIDARLKKMAQKYYEQHYGTREYFIQEFGRSYL